MESKKKQPTVVCIMSGKGGCARTTSAIQIGAFLGLNNYKVLLVDMDPQANLTHYTIGDLEEDDLALAECIFTRQGLDDLIVETDSPNLFVCPAKSTLNSIPLSIAGWPERDQALIKCFAKTRCFSEFDFVITDHSPTIDMLHTLAFNAADYYLCPLSSDYSSLTGLSKIVKAAGIVRASSNPDLKPLGAFLTAFDKRIKFHHIIRQKLERDLKGKCFKTVIRTNANLGKIPVEKQTIFQYEGKNGRGSTDYTALSTEILKALGLKLRVRDKPRIVDRQQKMFFLEAANG